MYRLTFLFVFAIQITAIILAGLIVYAIVFNPEAIGALFARIIIGFQQAFGGSV